MDTRRSQQIKKSGHGKLYVMFLLLAIDLGLNSSLDYDVHNIHEGRFVRLGLFGFQIVVQISVFLVVFLTIADTFLFRVGLLNILLRKIRAVLCVQALYFILTIVVGTTRIKYFNQHSKSDDHIETQTDSSVLTTEDLLGLVTNNRFVAISILHKCIAVLYYIFNLQTTIKLEDPIYFNKDAWIALIKEHRARQ